MSTRMPPRGRPPQRQPNKPQPAREETARSDAPRKQGRGGFFVMALVVLALVVVYIQVMSNPSVPVTNGSETGGGKAAATPVTEWPVITEVMTSNSGAITTEAGVYADWIELYNATGKTINLAGFALTDNLKKPTKFVLPSWTLEPGEYAIIFADGRDSTKDELHANFKLKSAGSPLVLVDPNGNMLQELAVPALQTNHSYSADMSKLKDAKAWTETENYTPGFSNNEEGRTAYLKTRTAKADVGINEVMAGNTLTIKDGDGEFSDWLEITNTSSKPVDITGWGLSNKEDEPKRWVFPKLTIDPGKYIVVFLSGKNRSEEGKELHADFRLNAYKDTVLLSNLRGQVVSKVQINSLKSDESWALVPGTDQWQAFSHPTPGYPNTEEGWKAFQPALYNDTGSPIEISEVMSNNASTLKDQFNQYPDWIEIHNRSNADVNLKGYALTDKTDEPGRWQFPEMTLGAGQYLTVFASSRNVKDAGAIAEKKLHTDFSLSGEGGVVELTAPDGKLADKCFMPALHVGSSYGRTDNTQLFNYTTSPTPGTANGGGYAGQAQSPLYSLAAGVYDGEQKVELKSTDKGAKIYYTLNGDPPTDRSTPYADPIDVNKPSAALGGTVIRAIAYRDGYLPSEAVSNTYIIRNGVDVNLPVLSIAMDNGAMFNPTTGMYMKGPGAKSSYPFDGANFWKDRELAAHMEFIEPDGTVGISQDVGLQIAGQFSRGDVFKSFDLIARSQYGKNSMDYAVFPNQGRSSFKSLVSRPGGQDVKLTGMRDVLTSSLALDTVAKDSSGGPSVFVQDYRTALEFVNGEFWGVTHLREKIDGHTLAQHYPGVDESKIDLLQGTGGIVKAGSKDDFMSLIDFVKTHDLSNAENYKYVTDRMDVDSYINWFALELNSGNSDMANIRMWRSPGLDNKWRWIFYDFCWTFWYTNVDRSDIKLDFEGDSTGASTNRALIQALLKNEEFKDKFIKQLAYHINVTFDTGRVLQRIDELAATMRPYMQAESQKWRELSKETAGTGGYTNWEGQVDKLRKYAREHPANLKRQMKEYFNLSNAQMSELFPNQ